VANISNVFNISDVSSPDLRDFLSCSGNFGDRLRPKEAKPMKLIDVMQVRLFPSQPTFHTGAFEVCNRRDDSQRLIGQSPSGVLNPATK
jgi:hypothetical protein